MGNFLLLVGVVGLLFQIDWRVGLAGAGLMLVMFLFLARLRNIGIAYSAAHRQSNADLYGYLEERLGGLEEISANGAKEYVLHRFYGLLRHVWHKSLWENGMVSIPHALLIALSALGLGVMLAICADLFARQVLTIGAIYLVFTYTMLINSPINVITQQMEQLQRAGGSIVRLQELQATVSRLQKGASVTVTGENNHIDTRSFSPVTVTCPALQPTDSNSGALALIVAHITFGYTTAQPVLCDLSFQLRPGVKLGVLGRTGSGKTSLARLLLRLYDPDHGTICLGDPPVDLRHLPLTEVRQRVGLVTQHVQLFHATLRDNLTFWQSTIDDEQLVKTLHGLGLADWLQSLSAGLDTMLAADGSGLSAGEAQLVAFARIFLRNPDLVILDEASSRLDPASEQRLEAAIDRLLAGRTAIIIAHRLSTLQRVDEILILDQGRIVEQGNRTSLAQDANSRFASLLQTGLTEVLA